jgi:hypothetical protein
VVDKGLQALSIWYICPSLLKTITVKTVFKCILSIDLVGSILEFYQNMWSEESNELVSIKNFSLP